MQAEVLPRVLQPKVGGGCQVKGQPAFLCRPQLPFLKQQELHLTGWRWKVCERFSGSVKAIKDGEKKKQWMGAQVWQKAMWFVFFFFYNQDDSDLIWLKTVPKHLVLIYEIKETHKAALFFIFKKAKLHMWSTDGNSPARFWQKNQKVKVLFFSCASEGL